MGQFQVGQRVTATLWGVVKIGTVISIGPRSPLVWVRWDGVRRQQWMHPESLAVAA